MCANSDFVRVAAHTYANGSSDAYSWQQLHHDNGINDDNVILIVCILRFGPRFVDVVVVVVYSIKCPNEFNWLWTRTHTHVGIEEIDDLVISLNPPDLMRFAFCGSILNTTAPGSSALREKWEMLSIWWMEMATDRHSNVWRSKENVNKTIDLWSMSCVRC